MSNKVPCEITEVELINDRGIRVEGVRATCTECGQETESYGTGENSRKRCLAMMREDCPEGQSNFYVDADE